MMDTQVAVSMAVERELESVMAEMGAPSADAVIGRLLDIRRATLAFVKATREGMSDEELNANLVA